MSHFANSLDHAYTGGVPCHIAGGCVAVVGASVIRCVGVVVVLFTVVVVCAGVVEIVGSSGSTFVVVAGVVDVVSVTDVVGFVVVVV